MSAATTGSFDLEAFGGDGMSHWEDILQGWRRKKGRRRELLYNINPVHSKGMPINAAIRL